MRSAASSRIWQRSESLIMAAASMIARQIATVLFACMVAAPCHGGQLPSAGKTRLYIGTLALGASQGIYQAELNPESGELQLVGRAGNVANASFLAIHPSRQCLYAACEIDEYVDSKGGAIAAFHIDADTGDLALINHQSSAGALPCHLSLDQQGQHALVVNYLRGNAAVLPIDADGKLGPATTTVQHHGSSVHNVRQRQPHPHSINLDAANRYAFVADAGTDEIFIYRFDSTAGTLTPHDPPALQSSPGAAPRHFAFHPNGKSAYVVNELDSTVTAMRYDPERGVLEAIQTLSTLPTDAIVDNLTAEIVVHPSGKFLYASNRGHDSIAMFAINPATGLLTPLGQHPSGGRTPRHFSIDPTGKFLLSANQDSNNIVVHNIDSASGKLTRSAHEITVPNPACIKFVP
ncbi:MAG: 6-phosphogluconolactonase [Pirellula sp.]|nr:6-phosphogluconolactonase [Pirellula sp.]